MAERGAALVTGGAGRVGRALAVCAADAGYDVAIHVRAVDDEAEAAAAEVRARGRKTTILACDLRKEAATVALVGEAEAELGPVTLLVNAASTFEEDAFADMNRASWDAHMETNLRAPLVLAQVFARRLPPGREGLIVNILDQPSLGPDGRPFSYALSRAALRDVTGLLAASLGPQVRINGLGPAEMRLRDMDAEAMAGGLRRLIDGAVASGERLDCR